MDRRQRARIDLERLHDVDRMHPLVEELEDLGRHLPVEVGWLLSGPLLAHDELSHMALVEEMDPVRRDDWLEHRPFKPPPQRAFARPDDGRGLRAGQELVS
jgi:hypothetical protein